MSQSLLDNSLHIVFSTKDRQPWILPEIEEELYKYMSGVCRNLDCPVININGAKDHIHVLLQLGKTIPVCELLSKMKSSSSRWIKTKGNNYRDFSWQAGYAGFSVSRSNIEAVKKYISFQKEHHKTITFKEELLSILTLAEISFDERYLWD